MGPLRAALVAAGTGLVVLCAGTSGSLSSWTSGALVNSTDTAAGASLAVSHVYAAGSCAASARGSGTISCAGAPLPAVPVTAGGVSATDAITNTGTLTAAQLVSEVRALSCGPAQLVDSRSTDAMLPRGSTAFGQADPWAGTAAVGLSSGAWAADVSATSTATLLGSSYSIGVWFKVANGYAAGGPLLSLDASPVDGSSTAGSPMLWLDTAGKVRFRVTGTLGTSSTGVSASAYNDGSWHLAVLSVSAAVVSTPTLYVDAAAGVSGLGLSALTGASAYWHLGWADFTGVSGAPAATLTGSLSGAFVTSSAVSSAGRSTLVSTGSATAYATAVQALGSVLHLWMLDDAGTTTYAGSLPVIGATSPCSMVDVAWSTTGPAATVAAAGTRLSALADGTWHAIGAPAPGATQTSTLTASRDATWNSYVAGLRLVVPLAHRFQAAPAGGPWARTLSFADASAVVLG